MRAREGARDRRQPAWRGAGSQSGRGSGSKSGVCARGHLALCSISSGRTVLFRSLPGRTTWTEALSGSNPSGASGLQSSRKMSLARKGISKVTRKPFPPFGRNLSFTCCCCCLPASFLAGFVGISSSESSSSLRRFCSSATLRCGLVGRVGFVDGMSPPHAPRAAQLLTGPLPPAATHGGDRPTQAPKRRRESRSKERAKSQLSERESLRSALETALFVCSG